MTKDLTEIKKVLSQEEVVATRVNDMGVEKNGVQNTLYMANSSLGRHWFVIPNEHSKYLKEEEKAQSLINWLEIEN